MAEQQLELETQGCERCGKPVPDFPNDPSDSYCNSCYYIIEHAEHDFQITKAIISKLIYGEVSKADLTLLHQIMFVVAELEPFATFEINQSHLAKKINWQQANVSRSLKKLVDAELLIKNGNLYSFRQHKAISKIT